MYVPPVNFTRGRCVKTFGTPLQQIFQRAATQIMSVWQQEEKFPQSGIFKDISAVEFVLVSTMAW